MPKKKIITEEKKRQNALSNAMFGIEYIPEPTYSFSVGDEVAIGNLSDCIVVDILENGKLYEIDYTSIDNNYGNPIVHEHCRHFWKWFDVRPIQEDNHGIIENDDLRLHYSQRQLLDVLHTYYSFGLEMNPTYQRGYVWTAEDNVALIDSIFQNIDIGKFVFVHRDFIHLEKAYEILDGKQRINALLDYYENRFAYKGLFYNNLSKMEQHHFTDYAISYAQLENLTEKQKIKYFLKLNRTGKVMDKKHLAEVERMLDEE